MSPHADPKGTPMSTTHATAEPAAAVARTVEEAALAAFYERYGSENQHRRMDFRAMLDAVIPAMVAAMPAELAATRKRAEGALALQRSQLADNRRAMAEVWETAAVRTEERCAVLLARVRAVQRLLDERGLARTIPVAALQDALMAGAGQ